MPGLMIPSTTLTSLARIQSILCKIRTSVYVSREVNFNCSGIHQFRFRSDSVTTLSRSWFLSDPLGLLGCSHGSLLSLDQLSQLLVPLHAVLLGPVGHRLCNTLPSLRC